MDGSEEIRFINGIPVFLTNSITKKVRAKKHRKKRIDKKWEKIYGYKDVPDDEKILLSYFPRPMIFISKNGFKHLLKLTSKNEETKNDTAKDATDPGMDQ